MKKQPLKPQEPATPKINFLVVLLVAFLLIALSDNYSKAKSLEASRTNRVTPSVMPTSTAIPKQIMPTFKPSPIIYPSLAPIPSTSPKPSPTPISTPITFSPLPSYTPCVVGSYTYKYLTDGQCQEYRQRQEQYDKSKIEHEQSVATYEKQLQEAYEQCLVSATQRAYGICSSLGTCDSYGYGGFDTILSNEKAKCKY